MEFRFSTRVNNRTPVFPLQLIYKTIWRNKLVRYVHAGSIRFCFKITVHRRRYIFRISFFVIPSLLFQRRRNTILFYSTINRFESNRFDVSLDCPRKRLRDITNLLLSHRGITFWLEKVYEKSLHKHSLPRFSFQFAIPISRDDIDSSLENSIPPLPPSLIFRGAIVIGGKRNKNCILSKVSRRTRRVASTNGEIEWTFRWWS